MWLIPPEYYLKDLAPPEYYLKSYFLEIILRTEEIILQKLVNSFVFLSTVIYIELNALIYSGEVLTLGKRPFP